MCYGSPRLDSHQFLFENSTSKRTKSFAKFNAHFNHLLSGEMFSIARGDSPTAFCLQRRNANETTKKTPNDISSLNWSSPCNVRKATDFTVLFGRLNGEDPAHSTHSILTGCQCVGFACVADPQVQQPYILLQFLRRRFSLLPFCRLCTRAHPNGIHTHTDVHTPAWQPLQQLPIDACVCSQFMYNHSNR